MYTEWSSLTPQITANVNGAQQQSTLNKFHALISRDVTAALVKQLSANLGITQKAEPSPFKTGEKKRREKREMVAITVCVRKMEIFHDHTIFFRSRSCLVHGRDLLWPLAAPQRSRNDQRLRQRLL